MRLSLLIMTLNFKNLFEKPTRWSVIGHVAILILLLIEMPLPHSFSDHFAEPHIMEAHAVNLKPVHPTTLSATPSSVELPEKKEIAEQKRVLAVQQEKEKADSLALKKQQAEEKRKAFALEKQKKSLEQLLAQKQREAEQKKRLAEKALVQKAQVLAAQKLQQQKHAALEKQKADLLKKLQANALAAEKKHQLDQLRSQQEALVKAALQKETEALNRQAQAARLRSIMDEYKAKILAAIGENWLVPSGIAPNLSCQLLIHLAPNGTVLGVELLRTSGDTALDHSAETAVMKASPLPVPQEPGAFDPFRELKLTVKPEEIVG